MSRLIRSLVAVMLSVIALLVAYHLASAGIGTPTIIAVTPGDSVHPQVAYSNHITHVVWAESGWIMYSHNAGISWTVPISIATGSDPALTVDEIGVPHLAFTDFYSPTINVYYSRYVSGAWRVPLLISSGANNTSGPDIAVAPGGNLSIVWNEQLATNTKQIEIAQSTNGGDTWPSVAPIFDALGSAPKIGIASDGVMHLIWQDDSTAPYRIKHTQRSSGAWDLTALLSDDTASAFTPELVVVGARAHVVWQQSSAIKYVHGASLTWSVPVTISTGTATAPALAATSIGTLVAAWDSGITITLRTGGPDGWGDAQALGVNPLGISHVALASGPLDYTYGVFAWGANGSRDIAFNDFYTATFKTYLPVVLNNN